MGKAATFVWLLANTLIAADIHWKPIEDFSSLRFATSSTADRMPTTGRPRNPYGSGKKVGRPIKAAPFALKPGIPTPPNFVEADRDAFTEWNRICALLDKEHRIADMFMASIATYCMKYADWVFARCKIQDGDRGHIMISPSGDKREVRNPWLNYEHETFRELMKAAADIGITPMTSMKVESIPQRGSSEEGPKQGSLDAFIGEAS